MTSDSDATHPSGTTLAGSAAGDRHVVRASDLGSVERDWERLAAETCAAPFLRPGWYRAWLDAFGARGFTVHTAWRDDDLVAVLPLLHHRGGLSSPTNEHTPVWGLVARDTAAVDALVDGVLARRRPRSIRLGHVDMGHAPTVACLDAFRRHGYRQVTSARSRSPHSDTGAASDWFATRLGRNRTKGLRRNRRKLDERGTSRVDLQHEPEALDSLLAEAFQLEASGWKGQEGTAIISQPSTREFYTQVAHWAADRGCLRLAFLRLDGRPLAFELMLEQDNVVYDLKGGYDEEHRTISPSLLLLQNVLQDATDRDVRSFEWLGRDEAWKLEWSDGVRERLSATWFAPTVGGRVAALLQAAAQRGRERLLSEDVADRLRALRSTGRRLRTTLRRR